MWPAQTTYMCHYKEAKRPKWGENMNASVIRATTERLTSLMRHQPIFFTHKCFSHDVNIVTLVQMRHQNIYLNIWSPLRKVSQLFPLKVMYVSQSFNESIDKETLLYGSIGKIIIPWLRRFSTFSLNESRRKCNGKTKQVLSVEHHIRQEGFVTSFLTKVIVVWFTLCLHVRWPNYCLSKRMQGLKYGYGLVKLVIPA